MTKRALLPLVTLAALAFTFIFDHELWTPDEPRDAEIAREMAAGGSWAVPTLNQEPFLEKPPLYFWTVAASYKIFGAHAWAARLPSILFAAGTLFFTFLLARRLFGQESPLYACLILGTMVMFLDINHKCIVDNALVFFTTAAFYWLYDAYRAPRKIWRYLLAYAFALGAFMSKGLIGVALIGASYLAFLLWTRNFREIARAQPWFAVLIVGAGAALWLACLTPELRDVFLIDNNLKRFTGGDYTGGHVRPFYYYGPAALYAFAPWILALIPALPWAFKSDDAEDKRFLLSWMIASFLLLSLASTKREIYLLPLCPAAAVLIGGWFQRVTERPKWATFCLATFATLLILGHLAAWGLAVYLQNWLGLGIALAASAGASFLLRGRIWPQALSIGTASLAIGAVFIAVPAVDEFKNFEPFCRQLPAVDRIPALDPDETTRAVIPFYTGRTVEPLRDLTSRPPFVVVVLKHEGDKLPPDYPRELARFGSKRDRVMLLLAR